MLKTLFETCFIPIRRHSALRVHGNRRLRGEFLLDQRTRTAGDEIQASCVCVLTTNVLISLKSFKPHQAHYRTES